MIMAVVKGGEFSARSGLKTVSIAKKEPATAALKPATEENLNLKIHQTAEASSRKEQSQTSILS